MRRKYKQRSHVERKRKRKEGKIRKRSRSLFPRWRTARKWFFFFYFLRRSLRLHLRYWSSHVHFLVFALARVNQALLFKPHKPNLDLDKTPTIFLLRPVQTLATTCNIVVSCCAMCANARNKSQHVGSLDENTKDSGTQIPVIPYIPLCSFPPSFESWPTILCA